MPTDWLGAADQEEFRDLFYPIMALGDIYGGEENGGVILYLNEKGPAQLKSDLPHVPLDTYWYWQAIIDKPQTVHREGEKMGRNDPCPHGSGEKYEAYYGK